MYTMLLFRLDPFIMIHMHVFEIVEIVEIKLFDDCPASTGRFVIISHHRSEGSICIRYNACFNASLCFSIVGLDWYTAFNDRN